MVAVLPVLFASFIDQDDGVLLVILPAPGYKPVFILPLALYRVVVPSVLLV